MRDFVVPALTSFQPEFLFVSAGFDAHGEDPLAGLDFTEDDYAWATGELLALARSACGGRLVSVLEGGYNPSALGRRVAAHVRALLQACGTRKSVVEGRGGVGRVELGGGRMIKK